MHMGANRIIWNTPTPLGDCLLGVYFGIFWTIFFLNLEIFHHIIMLWFTFLKIAKNMSFKKKIKSIYKSLCFWVFFIH